MLLNTNWIDWYVLSIYYWLNYKLRPGISILNYNVWLVHELNQNNLCLIDMSELIGHKNWKLVTISIYLINDCLVWIKYKMILEVNTISTSVAFNFIYDLTCFVEMIKDMCVCKLNVLWENRVQSCVTIIVDIKEIHIDLWSLFYYMVWQKSSQSSFMSFT